MLHMLVNGLLAFDAMAKIGTPINEIEVVDAMKRMEDYYIKTHNTDIISVLEKNGIPFSEFKKK